VNNANILTEAPPGVFTEDVNNNAKSFTWEVNPGVDKAACRMQQKNFIQVIGFWQNCAAAFTRGD